ncbi:hypothetical protein BTM29_09985 [Companilactobacillus allii]|uniref:Uncharacterized protein n=1 Tax=Companilactobacillus allii TaxID=1847728 RepID=A0A1P8Q4T1_9LACO|nr:hypothetical protein [Companilactobacillus allii]APX72858.1 hypothetical protein BTM29_09985 [Companilactobacillus allii]
MKRKSKNIKKTLDEYGVNVSQNTQKAMKSFNDLSKSATNDMALLDSTTNDQSKQLSSDVVSKYDKMATIVTGRFDKMKTDSEKSIKQLNSDLGAVGDQMTKNVNGHIDDVTGDSTKEVKEAQATIHRIYKQVGGDLSQMNSTQKHSFEDAQSLITEQTSAFAISLRDQQALLNAYKNQHGNITTKMYREDIKKQENAHHETYETAKKEQDKELAQLKKDHKAHLITDKQYQDESTVSLNKYQAKITKSNIVYYKDQDTTYKHYKDTGTQFLATKQSIYEASTQIDSKGQKTYKSVMTGSYVSRAQWIEEAKTQNAKYIKQQKELHGTAESNLDSYYKKQVSFYEKMGLSRKEAIVQATADRDNIESETDKTASNIAAEAEKIQKSYIKGLQSNKNGTPAEVASKWGLDITSKVKNIDLGKYGKKSAKQLWTDFTSGSKDGQEEAKLYYLQMFQDWKSNGKKSIKDLTDDNKTALHEGLESGVLSIKNLKNKYGKAIFDLFPSDMSKIPDQEIKSLKSAYENNVVSLNDLKNKFGDKIYQIFPNDLSDLGKKEVDTLNEGLQNGQIKSSELKAKFGPQLEAIYKKDLSDVGQDDIDTLQTALDLGITNKSDLQQKFGSTIDRIYNQTPKLNKISKANISTLQQAMSLGITNTQDIEDKYKFQLNQIYNKDLTDLGKGQIETLADGLKLGLPSVQAEMKKIQGQINKNATVDLKGKGKFNIESLAEGLESGKLSVSQFMSGLNKLVKKSAEIDLTDKGSNAIQTYADGANGNIGSATKAISNVRTQSESGLTPTGLPYQHGADITTSYGSGIYDMISNPLGNALLVHDGSIAQLQSSDLAKKYGADKSTAFGNGILTNSGLPLSVSASIANGVNGNFNDGIDSANNVSNQLGSKSSYKKHTSKTKTSLPSATPWKTGTNGKIASLTPSIVGDGYEPELIDYGNGSLELSPAVPTFRMLNPGAQVFSGSDTKIISNALNGMGISMFANGTGGNVGEWISNTAKTSWDWIKNVSGDLIDWISKPKETWSKLIEGQFDSSAFSGNAASIGTGTKSTEKKQTNWLDKLVKSIMSTGGSYDPAMIIKAAAIMGVHPTDSFIKMLQATIQSESGGRSVTQQIHDTNSGGQEAAGILQYTPGTFATFAMPGHTNRMNPFDELLAFFNNSDWANSIGPTVIWGTPKIDWLHSGPQGHRRMNQGGHVYSPETIDIAEKGKDEFVINPWESTASGLTTELLQRINDVQPNALGKIVLPGQGVSPESISKFKSLPVSRNSDNQAIDNLDANNSNSEGIIASLIQKFDNLVESLSGDTTVNINVDGVSLATATFPKMKLLMNDYINAEMTRRGR